ncbi:uncharacterized protein [Euwallacea fornicatus]|uniref:uncharacterized protein n=1 Tax=Euwallacea fornicatus TaxID=995702 RepID=UPI0033902389
MDKIVACLLISHLALASAYPAKVLQGPSTKTKLIGPDGSIIDSYIPGGKVVLEGNVGSLLQSAPVVLAQAAVPEVPTVALQESILSRATKTSNEMRDVSKAINAQNLLLNHIVESGNSANTGEEAAETSSTMESITSFEDMEYMTTDSAGIYMADNAEQQYDDGSYRPEHY